MLILQSQATTNSPKRKRDPEQLVVTVLFLLPAFIFLIAFVVWPIISSFQLSLLKWNGLGQTQQFVGLDNWARLVKDPVFWNALKNNIIIAVLSILIQTPIALLLAWLLERGGRKMRIFKVAYFFPMLISTVAIGFLFKYIYDPNFGMINGILRGIGLNSWAQDWLGSTQLALFSVIAVICWQFIPFYMVLYSAALSNLPPDVRDAALIDGANERQFFFRIALPMIRGTIRTGIILSLIGSLRYFDLIWVMTEGGPSRSSELMATYMYRTVFASFNLGYGSTIASALFIVVMVIALSALALSRRLETEV